MTKLTLPIEAGKKYVQRDGAVVATIDPKTDDWIELSGSGTVTRAAGKYWYNSHTEHDCDLVADYIEPVATEPARARVHAAQIIAWANGAEIEFRDPESKSDWCAVYSPTWSGDWEYRVKSKFIDINGHRVPEPMRVAPPIDTPYWMPALNDSMACVTQSSAWEDDSLDRQRLERGICHFTREAAEIHATALLSFTKVKP